MPHCLHLADAYPTKPRSSMFGPSLNMRLAFACGFIALLPAGNTLTRAAANLDEATRNDALQSQVNTEFHLIESEIVSIDLLGGVGVPVLVTVPVDGETVTLDLQPHSSRAENYQVFIDTGGGNLVEVEPGPVRTMRGTLLEDTDSIVAASRLDEGLAARMIFGDGREYWIEPLSGRIEAATADQHVIYRSQDILPHGGTCGADVPTLSEAVAILDSEETATAGGGACGAELCIAEIACDADTEFHFARGGVEQTETWINTTIDTVNIQYERDVEITHRITTIIVRTQEPDPYTTSDAGALLSQFTNHWNANHADIAGDTNELFTGKALDGSTIGIAWRPGLCHFNGGTFLGYNVVESNFNGNFSCRTDLSAHELGHNWSAFHCECAGWTMNPSITCANQFHPTFTVPTIVSWRNSHTFCLEGGYPIPDNDECVDRPLILDGDFPLTTLGASTDGFDLPPECDEGGGTAVDSDIWYCWISLCDGTAEVSLCGEDTTFDSRIAVYEGCTNNCPATNETLVACNDDGCGDDVGASVIEFPVAFGDSFLIRIGGPEAGDATMSVMCTDVAGQDANITDAQSLRTHGAGPGTELAIDLDETGGIEPRLGGIAKLVFEMSETMDEATVDCANVQIDCSNGSMSCDAATLTGQTTVTLDVTSNVGQAGCCRISFDGMATDSGGIVADDYEVVVLEGDVNTSGAVTGADPSLIKPHFGEIAGIDLDSPLWDFDVSGAVTGGDFALIKPRLGNVAPECP